MQQVQYVSHSHWWMHNIFLLPCLLPQRGIEFLGCQWSEPAYTQGHQVFFLLGRVGKVLDFLNFFFVPTVFPQKVSTVFPNVCPIYLPPMLSSWNLHRWATIGTYVFVCLEWIFLYCGLLKVSNFFCDGPIEEAACKKTILNLEVDP